MFLKIPFQVGNNNGQFGGRLAYTTGCRRETRSKRFGFIVRQMAKNFINKLFHWASEMVGI